MNLFDQIINQAKLNTPGQFSGGSSFGSINTQDFQSKLPIIQKSVQAEQNLINQGFSEKEVKFLKLQKQKGVDMNQAFAFVEQKRKEEAQAKNAPTNFDMVGGVISEIPKVAGETASFMSKMGAYTPMSMASAAIKAPFSDKTYGEIREEQKNAGNVFSDIGQKGKDAIQSTGLYNPNSTGAKIGEFGTDIASTFVGPNKGKILKEGAGLVSKYLPKVLNLAQEGAVMGAKYDIATKGEITKEGTGYGALGNVVFGGVFGATKRGYDIVKNQLPASLTLGGLINPGKLDVVKKSLQMDEGVATPQDVGKWILDRVKPGNKQEIAEQLIQHAEKTKGAVDESLASIPTYFKNAEAKKALLQIRNELEGKVGLESKLAKIDELLSKPDYTLSELNAIKRELDDMYNLYTKTGDPTAGLKAEGLRNVRANIRKFIEDEAEKYGVNVRKLNNETATARGLADGILRKDSADGVRELLTAFAPSGAGAVVGAGQAMVRGEDPLTVLRDALIGAVGTKIATSTAVRTRIASALNRLSEKELTALQTYIRSGGKDAIGKKVAEKVIKEGRALPARTLTKEADFAKPPEKAIITPQTLDKGIIQESKRGLSPNVKRPNGNTNNTPSNSSNVPSGAKKVQKPSPKVTPKAKPKTETPIMKKEGVYPSKFKRTFEGGGYDDMRNGAFHPELKKLRDIARKYELEYNKLDNDIGELLADEKLVPKAMMEARVIAQKKLREYNGKAEDLFEEIKIYESEQTPKTLVKPPQVKPVEKKVLTPKKESATMGDMETKKLIDTSSNGYNSKRIEYKGGSVDFEVTKNGIDIDKIITGEKRIGIGSELLKEVEKYAIKNGINKIQLSAQPLDKSISREGLYNFYKKNGYIDKGDGIFEKILK